MGKIFLSSEDQTARLSGCFPLSHGVLRVDDRRGAGGIISVRRPAMAGRARRLARPPKTLCNRFLRWNRLGAFDRIFAVLSSAGPEPERIMIDAPHLKARRTAASLLKKEMVPVASGEQKAT